MPAKSHTNASLEKLSGKPMNVSQGHHTKSQKAGGVNSSINSGKFTASTRLGYGTEGVEGGDYGKSPEEKRFGHGKGGY